jgi:homogentisate 1,2-dioxygenase
MNSISGTSFTTARVENRRTWTYRIQPSVVHHPLCAYREPADPQRTVQRSRGDADAVALVAVSHPA